MKIKRLLSFIIMISMLCLAVFSVSADEFYDNSVEYNTKDNTIFADMYTPAEGADGVTVWLRVEGSEKPFYIGRFKFNVDLKNKETGEVATKACFSHGQDGMSRNAMWKIDGDGDYLFWIPFKHYSIQHEYDATNDVVAIGSMSIQVHDVTAAGDDFLFNPLNKADDNPNAKISLLGIFDNKVEEYDTTVDLDGEKTNITGTYTYNQCEISMFNEMTGGGAEKTGNLYVAYEFYDPDLGARNKTVDQNDDTKDTFTDADVEAEKTRLEGLGLDVFQIKNDNEKTVNRIDYTNVVLNTWTYAKVASMPEDPALEEGEVFSGWAGEGGVADFPRKGNTLYGSISSGVIVTYIDEDGETELGTEEVALNGDAKAEIVPTKEGNKFQKFTFDKWVDKNGEEVSLNGLKENVTVYASYTEEFVNAFSDVADEDWWFESVKYICSNGLMNGMTETTFEPNTTTTRAMVVKILYDNEGKPDVSAVDCPFTDLEAGAWYENAVKWAFDKGVVKGMTETTFEPNTPVTRQQFCVILHGYAEKVINLKYESYALSRANLNVFPDKDQIADWARDSLKYCTVMGCISGSTQPDGQVLLLPNDQLTRAQLASMLRRFLEFIEAH